MWTDLDLPSLSSASQNGDGSTSDAARRRTTASLVLVALVASLLTISALVSPAPAEGQNNNAIAQAAAGNISIDNFNRNSVIAAYNDIVVPASNRTPGWTGSTSSCNAGSVSASYREGALALINYYREYAGDLNPAIFDAGNNQKAQEASLVFRANNILSHNLGQNDGLNCWTSNAQAGAANSNIGFGYTNLRTITEGYIVDPGSNNLAVGHRRWILSPKVRTMGMGATSNTNAMWVKDSRDSPNAPDGSPAIITWPPRGYMHEAMVPARWSISILQDNLDVFSCGFTCINWSGADVDVKVNGQTIGRSIVYTDQFGVIGPTLVIEPNLGTITNGFEDRNVEVTVTYQNNGVPQTYRWTTTVIDPAYTPPEPQAEPVYNPGSVASGVQADGRTVVAVRDGFNVAWTRTQTGAGGNNWTAWKKLGGCVTELDIAQDASGKLAVAGIGCGGNAVFVTRQTATNSTNWTSWQGLGGCVEDIALERNLNGRLTVAAIGCGSQSVFFRTENDNAGSAWSGWASLGGCVEQIDLDRQANGRLVVAAIGCGSRSVFTRTQSQANKVGFQPWQNLGGCVEQMALESGINSKLTVAGIGCGGRSVFLRTQTAQNSTSWTGWQGLGGCVRQLDIAAGQDNKLVLAAIGCGSNTVFTRTQTAASAWSGWADQGGCVQNVTVTDRSANKVVITAVACNDHRLFTRVQSSAGSTGFVAWKTLGGTIGLG